MQRGGPEHELQQTAWMTMNRYIGTAWRRPLRADLSALVSGFHGVRTNIPDTTIS